MVQMKIYVRILPGNRKAMLKNREQIKTFFFLSTMNFYVIVIRVDGTIKHVKNLSFESYKDLFYTFKNNKKMHDKIKIY